MSAIFPAGAAAAAAAIAHAKNKQSESPQLKAYRKALASTVDAASKALKDQGASGYNRAAVKVDVPLSDPAWKESGVSIPVSDTVKKHLTTRLGEAGFNVTSIEAKADSVSITASQKVGMVKGLGWAILGR